MHNFELQQKLGFKFLVRTRCFLTQDLIFSSDEKSWRKMQQWINEAALAYVALKVLHTIPTSALQKNQVL